MDSSLPVPVSASKRRRIRGAATKHKLYEASQQSNMLSMICSQLAMLTSVVDTLNCFLSPGCTFHCSQAASNTSPKLDASTPEFIPSSAEDDHRDLAPKADGVEQYLSNCSEVVAGIRSGSEGNAHGSWVTLPPPTEFKMKRYSFRRSAPSSSTEGVQPRVASGTWLRVEWPSALELSADDVLNHFSVYGEISDLEWLENANRNSVETMKLYFASRSSFQEVMRRRQHSVRREADGKLISVKTYVKFNDNAATEQVKTDKKF